MYSFDNGDPISKMHSSDIDYRCLPYCKVDNVSPRRCCSGIHAIFRLMFKMFLCPHLIAKGFEVQTPRGAPAHEIRVRLRCWPATFQIGSTASHLHSAHEPKFHAKGSHVNLFCIEYEFAFSGVYVLMRFTSAIHIYFSLI